jgi:hypothetical protein
MVLLICLAVPAISTAATDPAAPAVLASASGYVITGSVDDFRQSRFSNPLKIDNKWTPIVPGTKSVLTGNVRNGDQLGPHSLVRVVTDLTKVIAG